MSIQSMTGFARDQFHDHQMSLAIEIKSVNHRFIDVRFKMPQELSSFETHFASVVKNHFSRGSFDVSVQLTTKHQVENDFEHLSSDKILAYKKFLEDTFNQGAGQNYQLIFNASDFLRPEFYKIEHESKKEKFLAQEDKALEVKFKIAELLDKVCKLLIRARNEEGLKLRTVIESHLVNYSDHFLSVEKMQEQMKLKVKDKILKKIEEFKTHLVVEENRLLLEVVFYLDKMDVAEEIERIKTHLNKMHLMLQGTGELGRRFEFMLQELQRETNTLGNKANFIELSDSIVAMKTSIEKMREQIQNIE